MSMGQPSDLIVIFKILKKLHEYQYDRQHNASKQCADLKQEAEGLEQTLLDIRRQYEQSHRLAAAGDSTVTLQYIPPFLALLKNSRTTLQECDVVLHKYDRRRTGLLTNVRFDLSGDKEEVTRLKEKLHRDTTKFLANAKPFELRQASDTLEEVREIRSELRQRNTAVASGSRPSAPSIPPAIADQLEACWREGPYDDDEKALDVLGKHLRDSTFDGLGPTQGPLLENKLGLVKAQWVHACLSQRPSISSTGSIHYRVLHSFGRRLRDQYAPCEVDTWEDQFPGDLDASAYRIWPEIVQPKPPDLTAPCGPTETRLTSVNLVSLYQQHHQSLTVLHSGGSRRRMVLSTKAINGGPPATESEPLDLRWDRVVPFYASGDYRADNRAWTLSIGPKSVTKALQFNSRHDLRRVQQAFTGYSVPFGWDGKHLTLVRRRMPAKQESWTGDIQVWWYGTDPRYERRAAGHTSPSSSNRSQSIVSGTSASQSSEAGKLEDFEKLEKLSRAMSDTGFSIAAASFQTLDPSVVTVTKLEDGEELVIGQRANPPMLVGLCQNGGRYSMWSTNLANLEPVDPYSVPHKKRTIWRTELKRIDSSEKMRMLSIDDKSQLENWDLLGLLRDPKQKSKAEEPPPCAGSEDFHSVILDFGTQEECRGFLSDLMWTVSKHQDRVRQLRYARKNAQSLSDRPRAQSMSQGPGRSMSNATLMR